MTRGGLPRCGVAAAWSVLALYGLLAAGALWYLDFATVLAVIRSPRVQSAVLLSLTCASAAAVLALLVAIPAGYALARRRFLGRPLVEAVLELPLVISPAALGALLVIACASPPGQWLQQALGAIVFAWPGIVLAQFVSVLGLATRVAQAAFAAVPAEMETVARSLGASPWRVWWTVSLPLARSGLIAAFVLAWAKAVGEFGATVMVAGTMAMRTETVPVAIFLRLGVADIPGTAALILLLLVIGLAALALARWLGGSMHAGR
ncbi:MAG: ABC transporter permease subunit [Planctomycetota bacterium]|nr:ABC transporter permease subunit [Planctomycetota bacterium]